MIRGVYVDDIHAHYLDIIIESASTNITTILSIFIHNTIMPLKEKYIITVDQGTSSTRSIIFRSSDLSEIVSHSVPIKTITPHPGYVSLFIQLFNNIGM